MFSTIKKIRGKAHKKEKKDAKQKADGSKPPPLSKDSNSLPSVADVMAKEDVSVSCTRRHSSYDSTDRRGSHSSNSSSGCNSDNQHKRRLLDIGQLNRYIDHVRKSVDDDNISCVPSRLCCAEMLRYVYQQQERKYLYTQLHRDRSNSNGSIHPTIPTLHGTLQNRRFSQPIILNGPSNSNPSAMPRQYIPSPLAADVVRDGAHSNHHNHNTASNRLSVQADERTHSYNRSDLHDPESEEESQNEAPRAPPHHGDSKATCYDSDCDGECNSGNSDPSDSDNSPDEANGARTALSSSKRKGKSIALFPSHFDIF